MRVLVANKFWYRRGGLERVMFDEIAWLQESGNEVAHFSTAHPANVESEWARYFVPYLELGADAALSAGEKLKAASRVFSNHEARQRFAALLDEFQPNVIHVHGIHRQLSPSILFAARRAGIPVVQTLHDFHHVCPADVLLRGGTTPCEPRSCGVYGYGAAVRYRCVRESAVASAVSAAETSFQRARHAYERTVSRFISPSDFVARIMTEGGWSVPCDVVRNAIPVTSVGAGGEYALYAGRLSREKGANSFLEAARIAGVPAVVAGEGPLDRDLRSRYPEVDFRGRVPGATVEVLTRGSLACVVPSIWFENAPMSVLEPMAAGIPVIASRIGGIPELIEDGVSGILVEPGNVGQLAGALAELKSDPARAARLGAAGRAEVAARFTPEQHLAHLLQSYEAAMSR